jgi:hypothetical protein
MLAGEAAEVCAYPARGFIKGVPHYNVDDASVVAIRMKSGAVVNLMSCCANRSGGGFRGHGFRGHHRMPLS